MTLINWTCTLSLSLACLLGTSLVHAQADDALEAAPTLVMSPQDKEKARQKILEPVPAGASRAMIEEFFESRKVLSEQQGDLGVSEQFARNWLQALPDDWQAHWRMALAQIRVGRLADYFAYAQNAARLSPNDARRAYVQAEMALKHLHLQANVKDANSTMAMAEASLARFQAQVRPDRPGPQYLLARTEARVYTVKGDMESFMSQYDAAARSASKAVLAAQRSVALGSQMEDRRAFFGRNELLNALTYQARAQNMRGKLFDADQSLRQGLQIIAAGEVSNHLVAQLFTTVGKLRIQEGRFREAEQWARKGADSMVKASASPTSGPLLAARGVEQTALAGQERWADAWKSLEAVDRETQGCAEGQQFARNPMTRALVLLKLQRWPQAEVVLTATWTRQKNNFGPNHPSTALTEGMLAWAMWENGKRSEALAHFDTALPNLTANEDLSAGNEDQGLRKQARKSVAEAYLRAIGNSADAQALQRSFAMAEWLSGSSVQQALNDAAQRTRFTDPRLQEALRNEQDIQRELDVLYRYINQQRSDVTGGQNPAVIEQMRQRIAQLSGQRQQVHQQIRQSFPQYEQMVRPRSPTVKEIAARLGDDEVFVQSLSTSQGTYVWAIDRQHGVVGAYSALDETAVARLVQRMRLTLDVAGLGVRAPRFDFAASAALYDAVLKPLSASLTGKKHVIVSTSGALAQVPFSALVTGPFNGDPATAPWLIRQVAISHVPGASAWMALKQLSQSKPAAQAFMGWGDPLFDARQVAQSGNTRNVNLTSSAAVAAGAPPEDQLARSAIKYAQIPALPETRAEVEAIADLLKADRQKDTYFGKDANRESVLQASRSGQLAQKRVIVFATHGLVPGDLPNLRQPALAMAADGPEDSDPLAPLLTLEDVLGLKLNADWVVLSACNTAAAEGRAEEALSGLARGFFYAGSRSLLVTHWSVESESASLLTTGTFAHQARNPGVKRAESLREAMLKVMADSRFSHPAFWAPYALVGEGGR